MSQCVGHTKAGTRCKRKAQAGSEYCYQHSEESELKNLEINPGVTKITAPKVVAPIVNRNYSQQNTLIGQAINTDILNRILDFTTIPSQTAKIFNLNSKQKWDYVLSYLKKEFPGQTFERPSEADLDILYSLLINNPKISLDLIITAIKKNLNYEAYYQAYARKIPLSEFAKLLIQLYKNRYFELFYNYFNIFAERFDQEIIKTSEMKDHYDYYKVIKRMSYNDHLVFSLIYVDNYITNQALTSNYISLPQYFGELTHLLIGSDFYIEAIEIYMLTHKMTKNTKKYIKNLSTSTWGSKSSPTWAYTVYKKLDADPELLSIVFKNLITTLGTSYITDKLYNRWGFHTLDLTQPILNRDQKFFDWLTMEFDIYIKATKNTYISKEKQTELKIALQQYINDKKMELTS